ncbi:Mov34/MPN/PAD-1 family protein [Sphingomonas sp. CROZ-RG-20F-R02-07]|uniref:Mov34/MPN/PAD-1 family protein n=1 Tax=Sphingomonas sp. CROZ-RG-20F-R02-07 TaxID=2914832 RepID=UPI001F57793B|nr:Mov34/MPN/PAD-1 family protein [Sphingomonas sp. CROZ-RG-20F-R02-07]
MGVTISSEVLATIRAAAAASPDAEVCGLLFGAPDQVEAAQPCANVAADPRRAFEIDPAALLAAYRRARQGGAMVIGHYHSHPSGQPVPSARDAAAAMGDGALWLIAAAGAIRAWRSDAPGVFVEEMIDARPSGLPSARGSVGERR